MRRGPRESVTEGHCNVNLARMEDVDARGSPWDSLPQRAKRPPAGGDVAAYSSAGGPPGSLPATWSPTLAAELRTGTMVPGNFADRKNGQIS